MTTRMVIWLSFKRALLNALKFHALLLNDYVHIRHQYVDDREQFLLQWPL